MAVAVPLPHLDRELAEMEAKDDLDRMKGPDDLLREIFASFASHTCDELEYVDGVTLVMFIIENMYSEPASPLPLCMVNTINMSFLYPTNGGNIEALAGIMDGSILRQKITSFKNVGIKSYLPDATIERWISMWLDDNETAFELNRKRFRECKFPYIFVPLTLRSFADSTRPDISSHQNGILIGKNGTVFRIEPETFIDKSRIDDKVDAGIIQIAEKIGLKSPTVIRVNQVCPQTIAKDLNCIFWTIFMCNEIIKNVFKYPNPNDVIKIYSSKPKEELQKLIKDFKVELVRKIIPEGLKKLGCGWAEFGRFNRLFPGYVGGKRRVRKTKKKRQYKRRKSSKK